MKYRTGDPRDPRPMDVWNAKVYFDDLSGAKNRPVIILEKRGAEYTVLMSTTHGRHPNSDIRLYDPYEVGLDGSSCIRTDRLFKLPRDKINYFMGRMCDEDIEMVSEIFEGLKETRAYRRNIYRSRMRRTTLYRVSNHPACTPTPEPRRTSSTQVPTGSASTWAS